jgi:hypothetical protein
MIHTKVIRFQKNITGRTNSKEAVEEEIKLNYLGKQYAGIGMVEDVKILNMGLSYTSKRKNIFASIPLEIEFTFLTLPKGFIIANAELLNRKVIGNDTAYIFGCEFYDINGKPARCNKLIVDNKEKNGIFGHLNNMNKPAESIHKYQYLEIGSRVNLISLITYKDDGRNVLMFSCDIIEQVEPVYFKCTDNNLENFHKLFLDKKVQVPLFEQHNELFGKCVKELQSGEIYALTIYGFAKKSDVSSFDFLQIDKTEHILNSDNDHVMSLGLDTLYEYMYWVLYNWICSAKTLTR